MAERAMRYLGPDSGATLTPVPLDDAAGDVATRDGVVFAVIRLDAAEGVAKHMTSILRLPGRRPAPAPLRPRKALHTTSKPPAHTRMRRRRRPTAAYHHSRTRPPSRPRDRT